MIPTESGAYAAVPMADYLAVAAVSSGVVTAIVDECPMRGFFESYLNPDRQRDDSNDADIGSIAHALVAGEGESGVCVIDPNDHPAEKTGSIPVGWTNKSIRAARDNARAAGLIPVLEPQMAEVRQMHTICRAYIDSLKNTEPAVWAMFQDGGGAAELTMLWKDGDTLCKMRPDRISLDHNIIVNYKTTPGSVEPARWARTQLPQYYVPAAFYIRGTLQLTGANATHLFLCQETRPPYLCSLIGLDPHWVDLGLRKVYDGLATWERCRKSQRWAGYANRAVYPEPPPWEEMRYAEKEMMDLSLGAQGD